MIEAVVDHNTFIVVQEGIRGQTRKVAANNFCEFKGLKLTCNEEG